MARLGVLPTRGFLAVLHQTSQFGGVDGCLEQRTSRSLSPWQGEGKAAAGALRGQQLWSLLLCFNLTVQETGITFNSMFYPVACPRPYHTESKASK